MFVQVDWLEGRNICREYCMDLVSIETPSEMDMLTEFIKKGEGFGLNLLDLCVMIRRIYLAKVMPCTYSNVHRYFDLDYVFVWQRISLTSGPAAVSATSRAVIARTSNPRA